MAEHAFLLFPDRAPNTPASNRSSGMSMAPHQCPGRKNQLPWAKDRVPYTPLLNPEPPVSGIKHAAKGRLSLKGA
jgi:hypothetical protein